VILELDICCDLFFTDTIDDLILISFKSEEEHALVFLLKILTMIFSMVTRLISRLSCRVWVKSMIKNICCHELMRWIPQP